MAYSSAAAAAPQATLTARLCNWGHVNLNLVIFHLCFIIARLQCKDAAVTCLRINEHRNTDGTARRNSSGKQHVMTDTSLVLISSAAVIGLVWLVAWLFIRIMRGEINIGVNTALLILLVAILVVPFAINFSAHIIANSANRSADPAHSDAEHESH
jgi:hypothetical protein